MDLKKRLKLFLKLVHVSLFNHVPFCFSILSPEHQRPRSLILDENVNIHTNSLFAANQSVMSSSDTPASSGSGPTSCSGRSPLVGHISFVPEMEEVRVSPIVSKRGYLNVLEQKVKVTYFSYTSIIFCFKLIIRSLIRYLIHFILIKDLEETMDSGASSLRFYLS